MPSEAANLTSYDELLRRAALWLESDGYPPEMPGDAAPLIARMLALIVKPDHASDARVPLAPRRDWPALADTAHNQLIRNAPWFVEALTRRYARPASSVIESLVRTHPHRLATLAADLLTSEPLAPPVRLPLEPESLEESAAVQAIVFEAWPHATHELFPLFVDALSAAAHGGFPGEALAAHTSWLRSDASLGRVLRYDPEADRFVEADLAASPVIRSAHLLLGPGEGESRWHEEWSAWCAVREIPVMNPASAARIADDKWEAYERWQRQGVRTPPTWLVPRRAVRKEQRQACEKALSAECDRYVVKPRHGTEGRNVIVTPDDATALADALGRILPCDDAVIQPYGGRLRWADDEIGSTGRCAAIRLNIALKPDGTPVAESGYVQVARDSNVLVASVGHGGKLLPLVRRHLFVVPPDGSPRKLTEPEVKHIVAFAEQAARVLAEGVHPEERLRLMGMDLLVEVDERGEAFPLALEVNPRPAGLSHSRFLTDGWDEAGEPGVSVVLWEGRR